MPKHKGDRNMQIATRWLIVRVLAGVSAGFFVFDKRALHLLWFLLSVVILFVSNMLYNRYIQRYRLMRMRELGVVKIDKGY